MRLIIFFFVLIISCNKKDNSYIDKEVAFTHVLNLKNYKYQSTKINDSIIEVIGKNEKFKINGFLKNGMKFGWWKIKDKNDVNKIKFEFMNIENEEYINQYIYFDKKGDTLKEKSLFYTLKQDGSNSIIYQNNFPSSGDEVILSKFYYIINNQKLQSIETDRKEVFNFKLDVPNTIQNKVVKGMFSITTNREKVLGVKNLYTIDTLYSN